jgi:hypothetical protein
LTIFLLTKAEKYGIYDFKLKSHLVNFQTIGLFVQTVNKSILTIPFCLPTKTEVSIVLVTHKIILKGWSVCRINHNYPELFL